MGIETSNRIKFGCAIMIVLHHYFQLLFTTAGYTPEYTILFLIIQQLGYTGVAIFFFLSGYGLMESEKKKHLQLKEFVVKRFSKVYFPYLFVTFLWLPIFYTVVKPDINPTFAKFLYGLLWNGEDNVLWFVKILLLLYVAFYLFIQSYGKSLCRAIITLTTVTVVVCVIAYFTIGFYSYISIPIFFLGVIYSVCQDRDFFSPQNLFVWLFGVSCLLIGVSAVLSQNMFFMMQAIINYVVVLLLVLYIRKKEVKKEVSKFDYSISFDIYLVHNKVLMVFSSIFCLSIINLFFYLSLVFIFSYIYHRMRKICKI